MAGYAGLDARSKSAGDNEPFVESEEGTGMICDGHVL